MKQKKYNLGEETLFFYDERQPEMLNEDDRDYLRLLTQRKTSDPEEQDVFFYDAHRNELKDDRKLKSAWDRFIFGKPREDEDFVSGIAACLESLFNQERPAPNDGLKSAVTVRPRRNSKRSISKPGISLPSAIRGLQRCSAAMFHGMSANCFSSHNWLRNGTTRSNGSIDPWPERPSS